MATAKNKPAPVPVVPLAPAKRASSKAPDETPAQYLPLVTEAEAIVAEVERLEAAERALDERKRALAAKVDTSGGSVRVGPLKIVPRESYTPFNPTEIPRILGFDPAAEQWIERGASVALAEGTTLDDLRAALPPKHRAWKLLRVEEWAKFTRGARAWAATRKAPGLAELVGGTVAEPQVRRAGKDAK